MIEFLLATGLNFAIPSQVYLVDTEQWSIRHCNCIHLPDFHEYCSDGWQWALYSRWQIAPNVAEAKAYLNMSRLKRIERLQRINVEQIPILEQTGNEF